MTKQGKNRDKTKLKLWGLIMCALLVLLNYTDTIRAVAELPDSVYIGSEEENVLSKIGAPFAVKLPDAEVSFDLSESLEAKNALFATIDLFGVIPVRQVTLHFREEVLLMPGGQTVGVTMYTEGALVVGKGSVETADGKQVCPADLAGVQAGDVVLFANGQSVTDAESLVGICSVADENTDIELGVRRDGQLLTLTLTPVQDAADGARKLGMWVRDSTAGIGTLSFYAMDSLRFGALGHAVTDIDTGSILKVRDGQLLSAAVLGVSQGAMGLPGELHGAFSGASRSLGDISENTQFGVFGELYEPKVNPLYPNGLLMAYPDEVQVGAAQLLTTIDAAGVQAFDCEIIKIYAQNGADSKGMVLRITDQELIEKTGGIVQGMSGSPVIQNGKLIGVVTHVFLNDPLKGYCIYALWMLKNC